MPQSKSIQGCGIFCDAPQSKKMPFSSKTDILDIKNKEVPGFKDIDTNPENSSYALSYTGR